MDFDRLSLVLPFADRGAISLPEGTIRSVDRSSKRLVVEVPANVLAGTDLAEQAGIEAGASIAVRTTTGQTYEGYIEVVTESGTGRVYWCGVVYPEEAERIKEKGER